MLEAPAYQLLPLQAQLFKGRWQFPTAACRASCYRGADFDPKDLWLKMNGGAGAKARERLVAMRRQLIEQLDLSVDGGSLALLGSVQTAIAAIDHAAEEAREAVDGVAG